MKQTVKWTATQILMCSFGLFALTACNTEQRNPDQIRKETAQATSTATKDAKAVAEGVVDGLKQKGPVNINKASQDDLKGLPGIDEDTSRRIIDNRPYDASDDLVKKHVLTKAEYDRIADKVVAR